MSARTRSRSGAVRIFLYNWPIYASTWALAVAAGTTGLRIGGALGSLLALGALVALSWSAGSLLVSHYIYDRSALAGGAWARALVPPGIDTWASIDAGLDAEVALDDAIPGRCIARLDIYDGAIVGAGSVARARATTPRRYAAIRSRADALPLGDATCDLVAIVFTAHEIHDPSHRERFFRDVTRALRAGGRILLVEHLRDLSNFIAFGPGFTHFQPRAEWLRLADVAGLRVAHETRITPWVMALSLEKSP